MDASFNWEKVFSSLGEQQKDYLSFEVGGKCFGVPAQHVWGITRMFDLEMVKEGPAYLAGVTHICGIEVPVIDLGLRDGSPEPFEIQNMTEEEAKSHCILVVKDPSMNDDQPHLGLLVERLRGFKKVDPTNAKVHPVVQCEIQMSDIEDAFAWPDRYMYEDEVEDLIDRQLSDMPQFLSNLSDVGCN
ncbi:MAG: chemotaxis protein CheW [Verrucomicrobiota bacterium]